MSWICTGSGGKLAELPCWIWKFSCQTFSPLNNDYVVQLPASLLPSWCEEFSQSGVESVCWRSVKINKKKRREMWVKLYFALGSPDHQSHEDERGNCHALMRKNSTRRNVNLIRWKVSALFSYANAWNTHAPRNCFLGSQCLLGINFLWANRELRCAWNLLCVRVNCVLIWYFMYIFHTIGISRAHEST